MTTFWQNYKHRYSLNRIRSHLENIGFDMSKISDIEIEEITAECNVTLEETAVRLGELSKWIKKYFPSA